MTARCSEVGERVYPLPPVHRATFSTRAAAFDVETKRLETTLAGNRSALRKEYLPRVYVAGGYEYAQNAYTVHEGNWSLLAGLDFNVYAGGVTGERLLQKERELALIERTREQLLDAVQLEVQEGFLSLQTARSRVSATERAVGQATTAEQSFLDAHYDVVEARARLGFAVGSDLAAAWAGDAHRAGKGADHE